jgi:DNA polymerase epsilon subunit 4
MEVDKEMNVDSVELQTVNPADLGDFNTSTKPSNLFPLTRVKRIMKEDKNVQLISQDALFLTAAATELFASYLAKNSYEFSKFDKRKTLAYKDVTRCIRDVEPLEFLLDVVPETVPAPIAIEQRKKMQKELNPYELPESRTVTPTAVKEENKDKESSMNENPVENEDFVSGNN